MSVSLTTQASSFVFSIDCYWNVYMEASRQYMLSTTRNGIIVLWKMYRTHFNSIERTKTMLYFCTKGRCPYSCIFLYIRITLLTVTAWKTSTFMLQRDLHSHWLDLLIQEMNLGCHRYQTVEIHALLLPATPGFWHLMMREMLVVRCHLILIFQQPTKMPELQLLQEQAAAFKKPYRPQSRIRQLWINKYYRAFS